MSIKSKSGILVLLLLLLPSAILVLRAQNKQPGDRKVPTQNQEVKDYASRFPIAEFEGTASANSEERLRREAISKKYDDAVMPVTEYSATFMSHTHWAVGLPAFPVEKSRAVVIGQILESQAYLSNDKTGVYSEFKIQLDEILHSQDDAKLNVGDALVAERLGGRVRFPSGHISLSFVSNQGMPVPGRKYVLFLAGGEGGAENQNFTILTGYELKGEKIVLLDNPPQHPISAYQGADQMTLLNELRKTIQQTSKTSSKK